MVSPRILRVAWGRMDVEGLASGKDFKLYPGGGRAWDWRETGTGHVPGIQPADVAELLEKGAEVVVLSRGIEAHVLETRAAMELYSKLASERPVGGPVPLDVLKGNRKMAHFPKLLRELPPFEGPFDAHKLEAKNCDVLFASYPKGTVISPHEHATENVGVITQGELILIVDGKETRYGPGDWYHVPAKVVHAARFEVETSEIEFWFRAPRGG